MSVAVPIPYVDWHTAAAVAVDKLASPEDPKVLEVGVEPEVCEAEGGAWQGGAHARCDSADVPGRAEAELIAEGAIERVEPVPVVTERGRLPKGPARPKARLAGEAVRDRRCNSVPVMHEGLIFRKF
jgi:hypothetical protein